MNNIIFIGNKEIHFSSKSLKVNSTHKNVLKVSVENRNQPGLIFDFFIRSKTYSHLFLDGDLNKVFKMFCSSFPIVEAAGGLIMNPKGQILFIYRLNKWDLPKGKIEFKEKKRNAAIRECEEECGIKGIKIIRQLNESYHMYEINGQWVLKKTYWYLMQSDFIGRLIPQHEEGIEKTEWVNKKDLKSVLSNTYPAIKVVLKEVI
ncbi:MAG: NUDIX hydrolase [Bacteroidota bacterium]|jgi:8-oxo-dGTP pyrophosphatase MutT (NUDIX family)